MFIFHSDGKETLTKCVIIKSVYTIGYLFKENIFISANNHTFILKTTFAYMHTAIKCCSLYT